MKTLFAFLPVFAVAGSAACMNASNELDSGRFEDDTGDGPPLNGATSGQPGFVIPTNAQSQAEAMLTPPDSTNCGPIAPVYVSADDTGSMASPAYAREALRAGSAPSPQLVRPHEFLNYYDLGYPSGTNGTLHVTADVLPPDGDGVFTLQVAVVAPPTQERVPQTLTLLVDGSTSVEGAGIERERAALEALSTVVRPGDVLNVVTWSGEVVQQGHVVATTPDPMLQELAGSFETSPSSDPKIAMTQAFDLAEQRLGDGTGGARYHRMVVLTDGNAIVREEDIARASAASSGLETERIYVMGVGLGPFDRHGDVFLDALTEAGRGSYVYLDEPEEAVDVLRDRFGEVLDVWARRVTINVTLPLGLELVDFVGEASSIEELDPQNLGPGDSMTVQFKYRVCSADYNTTQSFVLVGVTYDDPLTGAAAEPIEVSLPLIQNPENNPARVRKANAIVAYAEALRGPAPARLANALALVKAAQADGADADLEEIEELLTLHPALIQAEP